MGEEEDARPPLDGFAYRLRELRALGVARWMHQLRARVMGLPPCPAFAIFERERTGALALEVGGPTAFFGRRREFPAYSRLGPIDLVDYAGSTLWRQAGAHVDLGPGLGAYRHLYPSEANDLAAIAPRTYDVLLASHVLEHLANPLGALAEWRRVVRVGGIVALVVPDGRRNFDHQRAITSVEHLLADRQAGTPESDRTHVPEILARHDLRRDPGARSSAEFHRRAEANDRWRALHHHVFDPSTLRTGLESAGLIVLAQDEVPPFHLVAVTRSP